MWTVAGVLLGLVVLATLLGFHSGPHAHVAAGVIGALAAGWLILMAVDGRSAPVLWALLGADVVVSAGVGIMALSSLRSVSPTSVVRPLEAAEGVAVSDLVPDGIVRIRGEQWSAVSVNGNVHAGARVQVLRAKGVRLEVWGEEELEPGGGASHLDAPEPKEQDTW